MARNKFLYRVTWEIPFHKGLNVPYVRHFQSKRAADRHAERVTEGREGEDDWFGPTLDPIPPAVPGSVKVERSMPITWEMTE